MLRDARIQAMVGISNPAVAKAFYLDTLGLKLVSENAFLIVLSGAAGEICLSKAPVVVPAPYAVLSFVVKSMAAFVQAAREKGVALQRFPFLPADGDGVWTSPDGAKVAWIRDPDMNLIGVVEAP